MIIEGSFAAASAALFRIGAGLGAGQGREDVAFARRAGKPAFLDARFAAVDARFAAVDARFTQIELRLEEFEKRMEIRFEQQASSLDAKLASLEQRMTIRLGAITVAGIGFMSALLKLA